MLTGRVKGTGKEMRVGMGRRGVVTFFHFFYPFTALRIQMRLSLWDRGCSVCYVVIDLFDYSIMGLLLFCRSMVHGY